MPKYTTNEFTFELPTTLHDRSMHLFTLSADGPSDLSIVIGRSKTPASTTLPNQLAALIEELGKKLPGFVMLERRERVLAGNVRAGEVRYTYTQNGVQVLQRQAGMLLRAKEGSDLTWVSITATFGPKADASWHQSFDAMLASLVVT